MSPLARLPLTFEHALLGFVRQRPMHAYEIHHTLKSGALGQVWRLKQSHLYALLTRLEEEGYIVATSESQGTRPPRRVLRLTAGGRAAFERWLVAPVEHSRDFRLEFLAKLFFALAHEARTAATLIEEQQRACQAWLANLRAQLGETPSDRAYNRLVLRFRIGQIEASLRWLETCLDTFATPAFH